jgi:hypothetical protein
MGVHLTLCAQSVKLYFEQSTGRDHQSRTHLLDFCERNRKRQRQLPLESLARRQTACVAWLSFEVASWSDGRIAEALDTSIDTIARTRQQLVEGGVEAALTRKHSPNSARQRIFDGAAEAKLIALACSPPPKGRKRWTLSRGSTLSVW